jgi:hypothetical protein
MVTGPVFYCTEGVESRFHVLRSELIFSGTEGVGSRFTVPESFSAVLRVSSPVFMFCAPEVVFGGNEVVGSSYHVLSSRSRFPRYRGRHDQFSCLPLPDSFSAVLTVMGPIFDGTEVVESRFHVLRSGTHFRRYRGHLLPF